MAHRMTIAAVRCSSRSCTRDLLRQRAVDRDDVEAIHDVLFLSLGSPAVERVSHSILSVRRDVSIVL